MDVALVSMSFLPLLRPKWLGSRLVYSTTCMASTSSVVTPPFMILERQDFGVDVPSSEVREFDWRPKVFG